MRDETDKIMAMKDYMVDPCHKLKHSNDQIQRWIYVTVYKLVRQLDSWAISKLLNINNPS